MGDVLLLMEEILHQLRLVVSPIIYKVFYIPGGAGFPPSTVGCPRKLVNGYYMGQNLLTNHLLTFGDIQVGSFLFEKGQQPCHHVAVMDCDC